MPFSVTTIERIARPTCRPDNDTLATCAATLDSYREALHGRLSDRPDHLQERGTIPRQPDRDSQLGGGLNPDIVAGRLAGLVEKRHLVLKRWFVDAAAKKGRTFIDLGTDQTYPFYDGYEPTQRALTALTGQVQTARQYPSSYGTLELRSEFAAFMQRRFDVVLDPQREVMITTGASQAFDAVSRTYSGRFVLVPDLALSTVTSIATGNGAEILRIPMDAAFRPDLRVLDSLISRVGPQSVRFVYINSPTNPTGAVLPRTYLAELVALAREHGVLLLHDHDSWLTVHSGDPSASILELSDAQEVAITVFSVSKELGLPGIRVGLVAGCQSVINDLRIHNSEFCVMIPEFCQAAVVSALRAIATPDVRRDVETRIARALSAAINGWLRLGWPQEAVIPPIAGYKFLIRPPRRFAGIGDRTVTGVELFDFLIARDACAKLSTSRSFNANAAEWMRMIIMQDADVMVEFFDRLQEIGVHYNMEVPSRLFNQFHEVVAQLHLWSL